MAENSDIDPLEERFRFTPEALELRRTLDFDPRVSKKHLKLGNWNDDTVTTWLDKWTTNTPDAILVSSHDSDITYGEIREHSLRLANSLLNLGIQKGDVVAIQRFGRFPHRNAPMGRTSTADEMAYLKDPPKWGKSAIKNADPDEQPGET